MLTQWDHSGNVEQIEDSKWSIEILFERINDQFSNGYKFIYNSLIENRFLLEEHFSFFPAPLLDFFLKNLRSDCDIKAQKQYSMRAFSRWEM